MNTMSFTDSTKTNEKVDSGWKTETDFLPKQGINDVLVEIKARESRKYNQFEWYRQIWQKKFPPISRKSRNLVETVGADNKKLIIDSIIHK